MSDSTSRPAGRRYRDRTAAAPGDSTAPPPPAEENVSTNALAPRRARGGSAAVLVAMSAANGLGYLLTLVASRRLGPEGYGALAALLGLVLVGNVLALGVQAVVARRVVAEGSAATVTWAVRLAWGGSLALTALALAAAPVLASLLHLGSAWPAVALAATLGPLTLLGGQLGLVQGAERLHPLAVLFLVAAVGKVGGGVVGVVVGGTVTAAMVGTAVGAGLAAATGGFVVRAALPTRPRRVRAAGRLPAGVLSETAVATYSLGGLFALTNVDVVLARHELPPREAGLYAVGAVIAKAAFWLPSVVPVIAMAGLSDPRRRRATAGRALLAVAVAGAGITAVTAAAGSLFVRAIGGSEYVGLADRAWLFAATGSLFAVAQLLLYSRLATEDRRVAAPMWFLVAGEVLAVTLWWHGSPTEIVRVALTTAFILAVLGVLAEAAEHGVLSQPGAGRS
jgi:hypothetical protein